MNKATMRRTLAILGASIMASAALAACSGNTADDNAVPSDCTAAHPDVQTVRTGTLTVATHTFPPFTVVEGTTGLAGAEGEILAAIAGMECLTVTPVPLDSGSVIAATQGGRVDLSSGNWYCTVQRAKVTTLAGPVYEDRVSIISSDGVDTFEGVRGRSLGTVDGYLWNDELEALYGSDLKIYPTPTAMYADLGAGRIDVAADSLGAATYANEQNGDVWEVRVPESDERVVLSTAPPQVCFPVAKSNQALADAIDNNLATLRENGELARILEANGLDGSAAAAGDLRLIG